MNDKLVDDAGRPGRDQISPRGPRGRQTGSVSAVGRRSDDDDGEWSSWMKRLRLQRHASLGSADEDRQSSKSYPDTGRSVSDSKRPQSKNISWEELGRNLIRMNSTHILSRHFLLVGEIDDRPFPLPAALTVLVLNSAQIRATV